MRARALTVLALGTTLAGVGCASDATSRGFGIEATGTVRGTVAFDRDGSSSTTAADEAIQGLRLALLMPVGPETVAVAVTDTAGAFAFAQAPVGTYRLQLDPSVLGDSLLVGGLGAGLVTVRAADTLGLSLRVGFPARTVAGVRSGTLGQRVAVTAIALHGAAAFSDSLLHVADASGALRLTRVRPATIGAGDSLRLVGRIAIRDGQRVLDDVTTFPLGTTFLPTVPTLTTAAAASASAGTRDAALVRVLDATIVDTATVAGNLRVTVNDGSGALVIWLDRTADGAFRPPYPAALTQAGQRVDAIGVLAPMGAGWALRPRSFADVVPR